MAIKVADCYFEDVHMKTCACNNWNNQSVGNNTTTYVANVENHRLLRSSIERELKTFGIKPPAIKETNYRIRTYGKVFGVPFSVLPTETVDVRNKIQVPILIVNILTSLEMGIETEGLFRKSGSISRQKIIRNNIDIGNMVDLGSNEIHDLACLLKYYLRQLPQPLILEELQKSFLKAQSLVSRTDRIKCIMLLCLLLPQENIHFLRYLMIFFKKVALCSQNKMDENNLSLIMTPNLFQQNLWDKNGNIINLHWHEITVTLIKCAYEIGFIPYSIMDECKQNNCLIKLNKTPKTKKKMKSLSLWQKLKKKLKKSTPQQKHRKLIATFLAKRQVYELV